MSKSMSNRNSIINDEEAYYPLAIRYTKKDGNPEFCNLCCGLGLRDASLILGSYIAFYSSLFGFTALLLKGAVATDKTHSLLWSFAIVGVVFCIGVAIAISIGTRSRTQSENEEKRLLQQDDEVRPTSTDVESR